MKIVEINIENFRLLKGVTLSLDEETTVIVGRNNSGKTSLTEFIRRILSDRPIFRIEDFSLSSQDYFWKAFEIKYKGGNDKDVRDTLPLIQAKLTLSYKNDINFGPLSDFIIDLNPECDKAIIAITYQLDDGKVDSLFDGLVLDESQKTEFFKVMKDRVPLFYKSNLIAIDPNDSTNTKTLEWSRLQALLKCDFINAQRGLDDETYKDKDVLGRILEVLFATATSESADQGDRETTSKLEAAVKNMQADIDTDFNENLKNLLPALSLFGYPGFADPGLLTETTLDVKRLLKDHTKIRYAGINGITLPETFNGLGARNLIFILLKLLEFFKTYKANQGSPKIQLVFIEEPEAHLHPQMQEVFIRQLAAIAKVFADTYNGGVPWPVQFIVSTHSSHIANEAPFEATRYFIATSEGKSKETICTTRIKDLSIGMSGTPEETKRFLHQYMTLTRCDLLFADKAILIEGTSERILLPKIIEKIDAAQSNPNLKLSSQYISIIEVGGAYANKFFHLLNFLELPTLIITDLDAISAEPGAKYKACKVSEGTRTSNSCLKEWFGSPNITPNELIQKTSIDKTRGILYLSYQIPEKLNDPCARSFEDAFMLANQALFDLDNAIDIEQAAWEKAQDKQNKKTEFALEYAIDKPNWQSPLYITEGLQWLANIILPSTVKTEELPSITLTENSQNV